MILKHTNVIEFWSLFSHLLVRESLNMMLALVGKAYGYGDVKSFPSVVDVIKVFLRFSAGTDADSDIC